MDFDAHNGESDRARELSLAAFRVLLNAPGLAVILETSGSGSWHVWAISPDFHDTRDWIRLLKSVASTIGTVITDGVCEIFPPDSLPSRSKRKCRLTLRQPRSGYASDNGRWFQRVVRLAGPKI
jgi:hypothetical protein